MKDPGRKTDANVDFIASRHKSRRLLQVIVATMIGLAISAVKLLGGLVYRAKPSHPKECLQLLDGQHGVDPAGFVRPWGRLTGTAFRSRKSFEPAQ